MANSDGGYERWRQQAAQEGDKLARLWDTLVSQWRMVVAHNNSRTFRGFYDGLLYSYVLLTGSDRESVQRRVAEQAGAVLPS